MTFYLGSKGKSFGAFGVRKCHKKNDSGGTKKHLTYGNKKWEPISSHSISYLSRFIISLKRIAATARGTKTIVVAGLHLYGVGTPTLFFRKLYRP